DLPVVADLIADDETVGTDAAARGRRAGRVVDQRRVLAAEGAAEVHTEVEPRPAKGGQQPPAALSPASGPANPPQRHFLRLHTQKERPKSLGASAALSYLDMM